MNERIYMFLWLNKRIGNHRWECTFVWTLIHLYIEHYHSIRPSPDVCRMKDKKEFFSRWCSTLHKKNSTLSKASPLIYIYIYIYIDVYVCKKERASPNCGSGSRLNTRSVCVPTPSTAFVYWFMSVIELDSRLFLLVSRFLDLTHREVCSNQQSMLHTHTHSIRKSTFGSVCFYYSYY